jgi:hypothetical protein
LTGLTVEACAQRLQAAAIPCAAAELARLHQDTGDNPRLLTLFIAHVQAGQRHGEPLHLAVEAALTDFTGDVSLQFLLHRIWRHLNENEIVLLELLAVFRHVAPRTAWREHGQRAAPDQLISWGLVQNDGPGGVTTTRRETSIRPQQTL